MKRRHGWSLAAAAAVLLVLLLIFFLVRLSMRSVPVVALPEADESANGGDMLPGAEQEAIRRVEVTPETVQLVIERLARPENYSRTVTIERYWEDGSGESVAETVVAGGWTRLDMTVNGETRHVVTNRHRSYVWYGDETAYFTGAAALTADEEQSIPTYENILALQTETIAAADYRTLGELNCIYVETAPNPMGYSERFWIAVDNGLLVAAERLEGETLVYRMEGMEIAVDSAAAESFTLPDGTVLYDPAAEEENTENEG